MKNFTIVGGRQSLRYSFEMDWYNEFHITHSIRDLSPVSLQSEPLSDRLVYLISNGVGTHWMIDDILIDMKKNVQYELKNKKSDFLLLDLIPLANQIVCINEHGKEYFCTNNYLVRKSLQENSIVYSLLDLEDISVESLEERLKSFCQTLLSVYASEEIIIVRNYLPVRSYDEHSIPKTINVDKNSRLNSILKESYRYIEKELSHNKNCHIIDTGNNISDDEKFPKGLTLKGYVREHYEHIIDSIHVIVYPDSDKAESDRQCIPHKEHEHSRYALLYDENNILKNTRNIAIHSAIEKLFNPILIPIGKSDFESLKRYEAIFITQLSCIYENEDYSALYPIFRMCDNIILMPVGVNSTEPKKFILHESVIQILSAVNHKTIGITGKYTASVLKEYGITNVQIIGCPSMYYWNDKDYKISLKNPHPSNIIANWIVSGDEIDTDEYTILSYFENNHMKLYGDEDFTLKAGKLSDKEASDAMITYLRGISSPRNADSWMKSLSGANFSIGADFHSNVMALRYGIPALFVSKDTQTSELSKFYRFPSADFRGFDKNKSIENLYESTDYEEFNNNYQNTLDNFYLFLKKNNLKAEKICNKRNYLYRYYKNEIHLQRTTVDEYSITYSFDVFGPIKDVINEHMNYSLEYSVNIKNTPLSVANIPFITNLLPIVWLFNATLYVDELDEDFYFSISHLKRSYAEIYDKFKFQGRLDVRNVVKNKPIVSRLNSDLVFYSGGVDATSTLIDLMDFKPSLFTIWGSDIFFSDDDCKAWKLIEYRHRAVAKKIETEAIFCKSTFRFIVRTGKKQQLDRYFGMKYNDNWWHAFQHGIALLGHAAPLSFCYGYRRVSIAASYNSKSKASACASMPHFDENVKFCESHVYHNSFGDTRLDKLFKIVDFSNRSGFYPYLRVCWITRTGMNCGLCEKCMRTIMDILATGHNPVMYGFDINDSSYELMVKKMKTISQHIKNSVFWRATAVELRKSKSKNPAVEYLLSLFSSTDL